MEENTTTTSNTSGGNSMMLIIGAIILAAILGYIVFSSTDGENNTARSTPTVENAESTEPDTTTMLEDSSQLNQDQQVESMPAVETMELNLNQTGTGEELDTSATNPNVKTFKIEAGSFYFKPNTITVNAGDTVRIEMNSVDMMHDFIIDELGVKMPVTQSGQSGTVEFTVKEPGSYQFYCSVGQHRQQGQIGTLIVQ